MDSGNAVELQAKLDLPLQIHRLPRQTEIALFLILQEALTNVLRHSGSRAVNVSVTVNESAVVLKVEDFGKGIPRS